MVSNGNISILWFCISCLAAFVFVGECNSCGHLNGSDHLYLLDGVWQVAAKEDPPFRYEISLCKPLNYTTSKQKDQCKDSSICGFSNGTARNFGNYTTSILDFSELRKHVFLTSPECGKANKTASSFISFSCGENLGSPELTVYGECEAYFNWRTSAACSTPPKRREVPCYVIDSKGDKMDLTDLIKPVGGHNVFTGDPSIEFIINVCSDIKDTSDKRCPTNTSACAIINGNAVPVGQPTSGLKLSKEGLVLIYESDQYSGCVMKPQTKILFRCPKRQQSRPPRLISKSYCQYEIEWETEFACPEQMLIGNGKTCQFTQKDHGVQIDLSPLKLNASQYKIPAILDGKNASFYLNVCGSLNNKTCNGSTWNSGALCIEHDGYSQIMGTKKEIQLKYADGQVIHSYGKGKCVDKVDQTTVISFICSNKPENLPKHISSDNCVHYFEWSTPHACIKGPMETSCVVEKGDKIINLLRLQKTDGDAWEILDETESGNNKKNAMYFMNVCDSVSKLRGMDGCGEDTALCMIDANGAQKSLGRFSSSPTYDVKTDSVMLLYTNGHTCDVNSNWSSTIRFICQPGHLNGPVLVYVNKENCMYEFEWRTAAVCPLGRIEGSNCQIYDHSLGISVDLSPLKSTSYTVETGPYKFYLSVCDSIFNTHPLDGIIQNASAVQFNTNKSSDKGFPGIVIGQMSDKLSYVNGYINLTYRAVIASDKNQTSQVSIIFLCDSNAGKGNPIFNYKFNYTYEFHWYTDLVCDDTMSTSCVIRDPVSHNVYDLSSLSLPDRNWEAFYKDNKVSKRLHINVCRRLVLGTGCDRKAAACVEDVGMDKPNPTNVGQAFENPKLTSDHYLQLNYSHGTPCLAYGVNTTYTTIIHFLCAEDSGPETGPRFLGKAGNCQLTFLWTTRAACPTGDIIVNNSCQLTDPVSGFNFDLSSLRRELSPYTVSSKSGTFQLNICGPIKGGCFENDTQTSGKNISVCEADQNGKLKSKIGSSNSFILKYSKERELSLIYESQNPDSPSAVIQFLCVNGTSKSILLFVRKENNRYFFEMKTYLACETEYFQCQFMDTKGKEYDLSPLSSNLGSNYVVGDSRSQHADFRYHLNFCRPLHRVSLYKCPGGATAACQINIHETAGFSLGTQYHAPTVSEDGVVSILYTNGSDCNNMQFKRSTRINLFCSQLEGVLTFFGETPECEYIFSMNTPYACPLQTSLGSDCSVTDPVFGYPFNLRPLQHLVGNVTVGEHRYFIGVCNLLSNVPEGCSNSSACQIKPTQPNFVKSLGLPSSKLTYDRGVLTIEYESGSGNCHGKYNRSTTITFTCDHNATESTQPDFIAEAEDCAYMFEWPTVYACPPFRTIDCSTEDDDGHIYDLSKLSLTNTNYYVKYPFSMKTFVINVCRSVVHTPESLCPYSSAACLFDKIDPNLSKRSKNIGEAKRGPYFEDGKLRLKYSFGEPCTNSTSPSVRFWETIIDFNCDKHNLNAGPEYIGKDDCTYYFDWNTAYACPTSQTVSESDCSIADPISGYMYNFTSLRRDIPYSVEHRKHMFKLNICGNVKNSSCNGETGMCQEEIDGQHRSWNAGKSNGILNLYDNVLFLNYSGGDSCHNGRYQRNTIIQFRCGAESSLSDRPVFLYETGDCTYYFTWTTNLACQHQVYCGVQNGTDHYDLSSLSSAGTFIAISNVHNDAGSYFISVCGPISKMPDMPCPESASICRVDHRTSKAEDIGHIAFSPFVDFEGHATAIYNNGSICSESPLERNRARIIFLCDSSQSMGSPVLIDISEDSCFYLFEWRTSVVCPSEIKNASLQMPCMYKDEGKGLYFDLTSLRKTGSYYEIKNNSTESSYLLNICDTVNSSNLKECSDSSVCFQGKNAVDNYGAVSTQQFSYDGKRLRMTFTHGDDCPLGEDGHRTSEIFFVCNPAAGVGRPEVYKKYSCMVVFMWETNLVCRNLHHPCLFHIEGNIYDLHLLSSLSHNWNVTDPKNNTYYLNLCRGIMQDESTSGCPPSAAVCMKDRNGFHMSLGMTYTVSVHKADSVLVVTYDSQNNQPCLGLKSSESVNATTRIVFSCGISLGFPEFVSGPDASCYYDFKWKTNLVCPENMEEIIVSEENGILYDKRLEFGMDLNNILNKTFVVPGTTKSELYSYLINLSGVYPNATNYDDPCALSAVCQTKPTSSFQRDVGSYSTRQFYLKGGELHLALTSLQKSCGRQPSRNVTTVIKMACSLFDGIGKPVFLYESGGCDYVFNWDTNAVCPNFSYSHMNTSSDSSSSGIVSGNASSSHRTSIVVGFIFLACLACFIVFILANAERRAAVASKFRVCFSRVTVPRFRYKRVNGERRVIVEDMQPKSFYSVNDDDEDLLL